MFKSKSVRFIVLYAVLLVLSRIFSFHNSISRLQPFENKILIL